MKTLTLGLFFILVFSVATSVPAVFADDDEWDDDDDDEREYDQRGSGEMQREQEREREHNDDDDAELALRGAILDAILYGTIAIIVASVAYTGFKIYNAKRPKISASR